MSDAIKISALPNTGTTGVPGSPAGGLPGSGIGDGGKPVSGSGGVQPVPHPSGIPGRSRAGKGDDKGDLAPSPDQALEDIKKGSR